MSDKIQTLHPERGKQGVNIDRDKYEQIKDAIIIALQNGKQLTLKELETHVSRQLGGNFEGSIMWYLMSVKLDLEARRVLQRVPFSQPQRMRMTTK